MIQSTDCSTYCSKEQKGEYMSIKLNHTEYGNVKDKGGWKYYCTVYLPDGTKWRPSTHGKTKRIAREKLDAKIIAKEEELEQQKDIEPVKNDSNTLVEQLKAYAVLKKEEKNLKRSSIKDKHELIKNMVEPYEIGKMQVDKIKRSDISEWIQLIRKDKSENRCKKAYNLITDYYSNHYCTNVNINYPNPAYGFKFSVAKSKADPLQIFDNSETRLYLKACEEMGRKGDILQFILYTYCREGEADTLTWSDWNKNDLIHIHKTWSKDENDKLYVDNKPKTRYSDRYIHLPYQVIALLNSRYAEVEGTEYGKPNSWIFPAVKNKRKPLSESTTYNWHKEALKRAGLKPDMRVHDLRHSGVSINIRNSEVDCISALSKQCGHSSRAITESIYEHVLDSQKRELAEISSQIYDTVCPWA